MSDTSESRGRRTVARHGRLRPYSPLPRVLRTIGLALACVLVAGVGVGVYAYWDLTSAFAEDAVNLEGQDTSPPDIGALVGEKGVDLLLVGVDTCVWETHERYGARCPSEREEYGEDGRQRDAGLNDVNLLVHLSPEPRKLSVVAFPRDLVIPTPECTDPKSGNVSYASDRRMLNETYSAGGLACVAQTIDTLTTPYDPELEIDYAATVTWDGVIEITNAIGGVEVCVDRTIRDHKAGMLYLEGGQTHTLVGEQALAFLRSRTGVGDGGDLGRISNQQIYMAALARKLMSSDVLTNPRTLLSLARTAVTNVDPTVELTPIVLVQIAMAAKAVPISDIVFLQYPAVTDPYDENRVAPNYEEAAKLFERIGANESVAPTGHYGEQPPTPTGTPPPDETVEAAPQPDVKGRTADDTSCASGNGNQ
jgi:LCP family protein required for cell wall assembly